jgi:hypothetical protein
MRVLQRLAKGRAETLRLVTFSVDPEHDVPDVLKSYADTLQNHSGPKGNRTVFPTRENGRTLTPSSLMECPGVPLSLAAQGLSQARALAGTPAGLRRRKVPSPTVRSGIVPARNSLARDSRRTRWPSGCRPAHEVVPGVAHPPKPFGHSPRPSEITRS